MVKFSNQGVRWSIFFILLLTGILCGCSFFDLHDMQSDGENLISDPKSGSANVAFNIVIPGRASLSPVIRAADAGAKVTFRITLLQPGDTKKPTITFLKTADVQSDGSATTSFSGLPEGSAIGEITIEGGNVGGKSLFHGASDLFPGDNTITVSPKGSLHQSDILANAMLTIAADPELIKIAKPNLVTNVANAAASFIASPDQNVYAKVFETVTQSSLTLNQASITQISIFTPDNTIRGNGPNTWSITHDLFFKDTVLAGTGLIPVSLPRNGIGDYAIIAWENAGKSDFAFTSLGTASGTLRHYLKTAAANGFTPGGSQIAMTDGSMVIAGSYNSRPTLIRWNGKENLDLSTGLTGTALTWKQVFEITPVGTMTATISYLEYDLTGTGKILCSIKDPSVGTRQFSVDPATGVATEKTQVNSFGLWAQVGSGSVTLGWDPLEAAAKYRVYYATGTTLATTTAPFIDEDSKVLLLENLLNNQVYTFQVAAFDSQNKALAWSIVIRATPLGAAAPIIYANWKLATSTFEIGSTGMSGVNIISYDEGSMMLRIEVTQTTAIGFNSIITGVFSGKPLCVKLGQLMPVGGPTQPPPPGSPTGPTTPGTTAPGTYDVITFGASMEEVFEECKYVFRGKMSQLPALSERLINTSDPAYSLKMNYLRGNMRPALRAGFTSPITASPSYGAISLEMENFELDPDVVVNFETSWGRISQFEIRIDGYAQCDIYAKFLASAGAELPVIEGTLLPHSEIPFFIGPVPGTWAREVTASWNMNLNAEVEVKAGTKMRIDFRSGVNYYRETGWGGQLLWRVQNTPILEARLQGTFSNKAMIEMKNAIKVGGLAGPELTISPYIESKATVSTDKPCQVDAALTMGVEGELKAIVQAWSYTIGEWGSEFPVLGPWELAKKTVSANATPTLALKGPYNLENKLVVRWPDQDINDFKPHVVTSTGDDSFELSMDDSKGLRNGISKVEVSINGNPAFFTANYDQLTNNASPVVATLTMKLPLMLNGQLEENDDLNEDGWYTPFRLEPGPHELEFKVFDRCGDHSIATCAIWVKAETSPWLVKNAAGQTTWEVGIEGFKPGDFPIRERTVAPETGALDIAPNKNGAIKRYNDDGTLIFEGTFTDDIRTGIWKRYISRYQEKNLHQIEFDESGTPLNWKFEDTENHDTDLFFKIEASDAGSAQIQMTLADVGYIDQSLEIEGFSTGRRIIGKPEIGGRYHIEIFQNNFKNGIATHSDNVNRTLSGNYINNFMEGNWIFVDPTNSEKTEMTWVNGILNGNYKSVVSGTTYSGSYTDGKRSETWTISGSDGSTTTGNFSADQRTGTWSYTYNDMSITAGYLADKPHGAMTYANPYNGGGRFYSGSYENGVPTGLPWKVFDNTGSQIATITASTPPTSDPIPLTLPTTPSFPTEHQLVNSQLLWSYLFPTQY